MQAVEHTARSGRQLATIGAYASGKADDEHAQHLTRDLRRDDDRAVRTQQTGQLRRGRWDL
jgi:hypothetical protein